MKIVTVPEVGIVGIKVELNHSELVLLKGLQEEVVKALKQNEESAPIEYGETLCVLRQTIRLLNNIVPQQVMSLKEADMELFGIKEDSDEGESQRY